MAPVPVRVWVQAAHRALVAVPWKGLQVPVEAVEHSQWAPVDRAVPPEARAPVRVVPPQRRFVERLPTVVQTRRLQGRPVLDHLYEAVVAHRAGLPAPTPRETGWALTEFVIA